jgi:hypothetical protein
VRPHIETLAELILNPILPTLPCSNQQPLHAHLHIERRERVQSEHLTRDAFVAEGARDLYGQVMVVLMLLDGSIGARGTVLAKLFGGSHT